MNNTKLTNRDCLMLYRYFLDKNQKSNLRELMGYKAIDSVKSKLGYNIDISKDISLLKESERNFLEREADTDTCYAFSQLLSTGNFELYIREAEKNLKTDLLNKTNKSVKSVKSVKVRNQDDVEILISEIEERLDKLKEILKYKK